MYMRKAAVKQYNKQQCMSQIVLTAAPAMSMELMAIDAHRHAGTLAASETH